MALGPVGPSCSASPAGAYGPCGPSTASSVISDVKVLFSRPVPGHSDFRLSALYEASHGLYIAVESGDPGDASWTSRKVAFVRGGELDFDVAAPGPKGPEYPFDLPGGLATDAQRLCYETMKKEVTGRGGRPFGSEAVGDSFWRRFVADLDGLDTVAEVMFA